MGDEPMLISQLVRNAIDSVAARSTRRVLGQGEPSDAALARLQAIILDEQSQPRLLMAIKGERALLDEAIRRLEAGEVAFSSLTRAAGTGSFGSGSAGNFFSRLARLALNGQRAVALEWLNDAVAISGRPASEQRDLWTAWEARIVAVKRSRFGQFTAMLPILLVPAVSAASSAFSRNQAELGATAILIAAERHRRRTGKWPASVKEIDPAILPAPPLDPFNGKPFHIEHRDGQLFIYSIGPNGKDDHGAFDPRRRAMGAPDDVGARAWDIDLRRQPQEQSDDEPLR